MTDPVTDTDILSYVDDQLDTSRRIGCMMSFAWHFPCHRMRCGRPRRKRRGGFSEACCAVASHPCSSARRQW